MFDVPRELTGGERAILARLLEDVDFPGRVGLRKQAAIARVSGECECGCVSRTLAVGQMGESAATIRRIPVEAEWTAPDGGTVGVLLHAPGGVLTELEIYRLDGDSIKVFPTVGDLAVWSPDAAGT
jgi:hypothetical protein